MMVKRCRGIVVKPGRVGGWVSGRRDDCYPLSYEYAFGYRGGINENDEALQKERVGVQNVLCLQHKSHPISRGISRRTEAKLTLQRVPQVRF